MVILFVLLDRSYRWRSLSCYPWKKVSCGLPLYTLDTYWTPTHQNQSLCRSVNFDTNLILFIWNSSLPKFNGAKSNPGKTPNRVFTWTAIHTGINTRYPLLDDKLCSGLLRLSMPILDILHVIWRFPIIVRFEFLMNELSYLDRVWLSKYLFKVVTSTHYQKNYKRSWSLFILYFSLWESMKQPHWLKGMI